jgi:hypothetical protein
VSFSEKGLQARHPWAGSHQFRASLACRLALDPEKVAISVQDRAAFRAYFRFLALHLGWDGERYITPDRWPLAQGCTTRGPLRSTGGVGAKPGRVRSVVQPAPTLCLEARDLLRYLAAF